ncbi:hypothetical protein RHECIAT_CH0002679 [Rhizobium etli CIAT 652]|uniref:Uncharacterized protein n=1 Tax=Rhizobium etli (strain CIAT 652) TaxID=491916 RepID=B3PRS1_RHIE6|nr:hypothetical protein RHECIAT_CH0002679 [Rhizobium etli CIAT 652]
MRSRRGQTQARCPSRQRNVLAWGEVSNGERMHRARAKSNAGLLRAMLFRFGTPIPLWHSRASIC